MYIKKTYFNSFQNMNFNELGEQTKYFSRNAVVSTS